jgi:hypothetical protein
MLLGRDEDVIEALAAGTSQESFAHRVHQRRLDRGAQKARTGALGNAVELRTELVIAVADDELRPRSERRRVAQLLRGPPLRRSARYPDVHDSLRVHVEDEEREDGTEPDVVDLQEIAGPNRVVSEPGARG